MAKDHNPSTLPNRSRSARIACLGGVEPTGPAEDDEDVTLLWEPSAARSRSPSSPSARRDPQRRLAWVHAYLADDDPQLATRCFREALKDPGLELDPSDALLLAEAVATAYLAQGEIDDAAELLRFASAWSRAKLGPPTPVISGVTVVASNPLLSAPATSRWRSERPRTFHELVYDEASDGV